MVGARRILMNHPTDILKIEVDHDTVPMDMDTPEEYRKYGKLRGIADALCRKNLLEIIIYVVYCSAGGEKHENRSVGELAGESSGGT